MEFHGFSRQGVEFLRALCDHNDKEWFEARREIFESTIHQPCKAFVVEMGEHLQALVPTIKAIPKVNQSLFRIYRDTRFSKDKAPIKTQIGMLFWQGSGPRMQSSCFYLHFDMQNLFFGAGIRCFDKKMLETYRDYIQEDAHREALHEIIERLKAKGYDVPEPRYKRLPQGFDKEMSHGYLACFDGMFAFSERPIMEAFYAPEFADYAYALYEDMADMQKWVFEMSVGGI